MKILLFLTCFFFGSVHRAGEPKDLCQRNWQSTADNKMVLMQFGANGAYKATVDKQTFHGKYEFLDGKTIRFSIADTTTRTDIEAGAKEKTLKGWGEVLDPEGDCKIGEDGGKVTLLVPGTYHDLWPGQGKVNAPMILQEVEGDFAVQVKVCGRIEPAKGSVISGLASKVPYQAGGMVIWQDRDNLIRLERGSMGSGRSFCYSQAFKDSKRATDKDSKRTVNDGTAILNQDTLLRLERRQGKIYPSYSQNGGKTWSAIGRRSFALDLPDKVKVGVAAINNTTDPFTASFADFQIGSSKNDKPGK
jgi:hypothetical protein